MKELDITLIIDNLKKDLETIKNLEELKQLRSKYNKIESIESLKSELKLSNDLVIKKQLGQQLSSINSSIVEIFSIKKNELENSFFLIERENKLVNNKEINLDLFKKEKYFKKHPLTIISDDVKSYFEKELNFEFKHGNEVEEEEFNFDILNIPKNHPARSMHDSLYFKNNKMLRTHSTNITARKLLESTNDDNYFFSIGSVFRNDSNDATHSFQFNQIDFFATSEKNKLSIANLKAILDSLLFNIFEKELETRYRTSYFPFTEPSFEVDVKFINDDKSSGEWIEILGCGMINNLVLQNTNKDPKKISGFAAGIGLERIAMIKWNVLDIRDFYNNDIEFIKKFNIDKGKG